MARTAKIEKEKKRALLNKRYRVSRKQQKDIINSPHTSEEEKIKAERILQVMPRDASRSRQRNRCALCGRSRAYNRLTGLCRIHMHNAVMMGMVPGMHKASW